MIGIGFREEQLGAGGDRGASVFRELCRIGADERAVDRGVGASAAFARLEGECRCGEFFELLRVDACAAGFFEFFAEAFEDRGDDEDRFFADAEQVVVEGAAFDDAAA